MGVLFYDENASLKLTGLTDLLLHLQAAIYSFWASFIDRCPARCLYIVNQTAGITVMADERTEHMEPFQSWAWL